MGQLGSVHLGLKSNDLTQKGCIVYSSSGPGGKLAISRFFLLPLNNVFDH